MNARTARSRSVAMSLAVALVVAACSSGKATPIIVYVSPTPAPSSEVTPAPTDTPAPTTTPVPAPTIAVSIAPSVAPSASPSPSSAAAGPAKTCTGTADHLAFFADAAKLLSFDAYCAALPSSWWLQTMQYQLPNGGLFTIEYKNAKGQVLSVGEGNFCSGLPDCWSSTGDLGAASFGGLSGSLKARTGSTFAVYVSPGTTHGYQLVGGTGVSQASVVAFAAAMQKIPKS